MSQSQNRPSEWPKNIPYCHLCECQIGWLHNATEHGMLPYYEHEPFYENGCETCWAVLAATAAYGQRAG